MDDFRKKTILMCATIAALMAAVLFYVKFEPEAFLKTETEPVGLAEIEADTAESYAGKAAGEGIPRIASAEAFGGLAEGSYVTAAPKSVVRTGIYGRKPWVQRSYSGGRSGRRNSSKPEAIEGTLDLFLKDAEDYREYCLIELEDSSYILAQLTVPHQKAIEKGDMPALVIGEKKTNGRAASALSQICGEYRADSTCTLYMVDDEWDHSHNFALFIVRLGAAAVVFFIVAVPLSMAAGKIFGISF